MGSASRTGKRQLLRRRYGHGDSRLGSGHRQGILESATQSGLGLNDALWFPSERIRMLCEHFEHQRVLFERCVVSPSQTTTAIL